MWGASAVRGGRVLLRVEDHDRQRSRSFYERAMLDDLAWLGFEADAVSGPLRQSDRLAIYDAALVRLRDAGLVYACECSRADLHPHRIPGREVRYPGTCAAKRLLERPGAGVRVRLEPTTERFADLRHGLQEQRPSEQCGDLLVKDREGNWTYQFAATVDDFVQGVTLVVRGDDLLPSTGRQMQLARLLGRAQPPAFLHHPLIMKSPGHKLSKSDGDSGIRDLRRRGWTPARIIGEAAFRVGLIARPIDIPAAAVSSIMCR